MILLRNSGYKLQIKGLLLNTNEEELRMVKFESKEDLSRVCTSHLKNDVWSVVHIKKSRPFKNR